MTSPVPAVTLEITVAPVDLPYARLIVPHQLRQWAGQVANVQFTLDLHRSGGRYGEAYDERRPGMERLLEALCAEYPHARVREVDYGDAMRREVAERFFGGDEPPPKHHYGGPVYSYFFGWHVAPDDLVLHLDCDLLFGGGSQTWTREAADLLAARPDALLCSPLPGPPTPDGAFPPDVEARHRGGGAPPRREDAGSIAYRFDAASTRLFFVDRSRFVRELCPLPLQRPALRSYLRARLEGHPPLQLPEVTISARMRARGLSRIDFLGSPPGMWSLHPAMRSDEFLAELPRLIERVETGDVPPEQLGDYDVNDSMVDWTSAREAAAGQAWWRRVPRQVAGRLRS